MHSCLFKKNVLFLSHIVSDKTYIFCFNSKNTVKIQKFHFLDKICEIQKNVLMENYLPKSGLQILIKTFLDRMYILCFDFKY